MKIDIELAQRLAKTYSIIGKLLEMKDQSVVLRIQQNSTQALLRTIDGKIEIQPKLARYKDPLLNEFPPGNEREYEVTRLEEVRSQTKKGLEIIIYAIIDNTKKKVYLEFE